MTAAGRPLNTNSPPITRMETKRRTNTRTPTRSRVTPMMTDPTLYKLLAWSSPGYPTGAFSYSHGLEWAVETGDVKNLQGLLEYVTAVLSRGGGWVDAVLFAHAWRSAVTSLAVSATPAAIGASAAIDTRTSPAASIAVD